MSQEIEKVEGAKLFCTPEYVSPETVLPGGKLDFRADIYSLGVTFFRLISGYQAFKGQTAADKIKKRFTDVVPDLRDYCDVSNEVAFLIHKMMRTDPEERFLSYDVLIRQIEFTIERVNKDKFKSKGLIEGISNVN